MATSLVARFDEIVASVDVLSAGTESGKIVLMMFDVTITFSLAFADYLTYHIDYFSQQTEDLKSENNRLRGEKEAKNIQLKLSR